MLEILLYHNNQCFLYLNLSTGEETDCRHQEGCERESNGFRQDHGQGFGSNPKIRQEVYPDEGQYPGY